MQGGRQCSKQNFRGSRAAALRLGALEWKLMKLVGVLLAAAVMPDLAQLTRMNARFAPVNLTVDTSGLYAVDRKALPKLVEAARLLNFVFMDQLWSGNRALHEKLQKDATPLGKARLDYFWLNKGPWSDLDGHTAFLPGVPERKPLGANFYPPDMTREEFEAWAKSLPESARHEAEGFFTVIRRGPDRKLLAVPYSEAYQADLAKAAGLLRDAAALVDNESLRKYLTLRADAFLSNDYYESDLAWMDLDAPLDITIGPYETYNDELFGYKAAFEAYVTVRDDHETARLKDFSAHLQEIENNLPIDPRYRNPKLGAAAPIRVVNEIVAAGDGAHGVRTAAFNLPNDERVVHQKGSKRVMLKNIQEAKFQSILIPLAAQVLPAAARGDLSFDSFFMHILAHELSHGIGPHVIEVGGRTTNPRQELKELYSAIEEAKADITGLFMLQYLFDHGMSHEPHAERQLYTTFLASAFRSLRFGLTEAHAKGMALQFNYLSDKGAFVEGAEGRFQVDFAKVKGAVRDLTHDLLTLEAQGDYAGAKRMLETLGVIRPAVQRALDAAKNLPTDINPVSE
jgi:Peptidase family M49